MTIFWRNVARCGQRLLSRGVLAAVACSLAMLSAQVAALQSVDSIAAAVEDVCITEAANRGFNEVTVTVRSLDQGLQLPQCAQPLTAFPVQSSRVLGAVSIGVRCAGEQPWTIYVRADVAAQRRIPVLVRPLASRSVISADDLEMVAVSGDAVLNGVMTEIEQVVGMELIRSMDVGSPIKVSQVRLPKLVKRGNTVTLLAGGGALQVRMQGKAMADGAEGDIVKATNLSSGQLVEGRVNADGTLSVQ
tara:strand:- start:16254 stop:16994 length:741 start_codon:yes stop_codon:yes gene_type:complete